MYYDRLRNLTSESTLQMAVVEYCNYRSQKGDAGIGEVFHVPNGGDRNIAVASKLKLEGVKPGVSDLLWLVPNRSYYGLAIELKWKYGKASDEQVEFLEGIRSMGYDTLVSNNFYYIMQHLDDYFFLEPDDRLRKMWELD